MDDEFERQRQQLVRQLQQEKRIISSTVEQAFLSVHRENFVLDSQKRYAYLDRPLDIGCQQTISAPHMVAIMVEAIDFSPGQTILEIGAGSGYHAAIVSQIIGDDGIVYSVERIPFLAKFAQTNLKKEGIDNVTVVIEDGSLGLPSHALYNHIYVTCAAPAVPQCLINQLQNHGSLLIPVGDRICDLQKITKTDETIVVQHLCSCAFVPLIGKEGFHQ
jgi:protein-L-isoaspartate(D-aspartate) O-methyltransferase